MKKFITVLTVLILSFSSCQDRQVEIMSQEPLATQISEADAVDLAHWFLDKIVVSDNVSAAKTAGRKSTTKAIKGKSGRDALIVVTQEGGGWQLIAADKRFKNPILAHGEGEFDFDERIERPGLGGWLKTKIDHVEYVQNLDVTEADLQLPLAPGDPGDDCTAGTVLSSSIGADVKYGQRWPENDDFAYVGCTESGSNGRHKAGCVAIALTMAGKAMNAGGYNFASMPLNPSNTSSDIDEAVREFFVNLDGQSSGCESTSAYTWFNSSLTDSWEETTGGSADEFNGVNINAITAHLNSGKAILMEGSHSGITGYISGHTWMVSQTKTITYCPSGNKYEYMKHNWGWGVGADPEWYSLGDETPGSKDYRYYQHYYKMYN